MKNSENSSNPRALKAWTEVVIADELDDHMSDVGQAKVNALLIQSMIAEYPLNPHSKVIIPGCGTGQLFDFISPTEFVQYQLTFSDINQTFLDKLRERLVNHNFKNYNCTIDNIEASNIDETFEGVIISLVLEHINWKKGISNIVSFKPQNIYLIIQDQSESENTITVNVNPRDSILKLSEMTNPQLIPKVELEKYLATLGYGLRETFKREVPNQKMMIGLVFSRIR